jgi:hypothetical protein
MQAISLWQPYASLIAAKVKRFETRSWRPPGRLVGQRIAIHAAARRPTAAELDALGGIVGDVLGGYWHRRIPYGAVVCTTVIAGCYQVTHWNGDRPALSAIGEIQDDGFGDYTTGRYCWELTDIAVYDPPVPAKGAQGFWNWPQNT